VPEIAENAGAGEVDLSPEIFDAISKIAVPGLAQGQTLLNKSNP
jgi:hypothetical protein